MATTVRELLVKLGVKADDKALRRFDAGLASVKRGLLATAVAAGVLAAGLFVVAKATARQGDEAGKAAKRVGTTAEEIQELGFAAEQTGASVGDVEKALRRQAVAARDASRGSELAAESYAKIGVDVKDASGQMKTQIDLFEQAADGIKGLKTETEKIAVVNDIFGRGGAKLLPLLNQGAEGIRKLRQQARDLGFVMSQEAVEASEDFTDRLNELRKILAGVRNQIGIALMPIFTRMIERFRDWFIANRAIIDQQLDRVVDLITVSAERLADAFERADEAVKEGPGSWLVLFKQIGKVLGAAGLGRILLMLIPVIKAIGLGLIAAFSFVLANPITLALAGIAAAFVVLALVWEDLWVFARGGDSAFGRFADTFNRSQPILDAGARVLASVGTALSAVIALVTKAINSIPFLAEAIDLVGRAWTIVVASLKAGINLGIIAFLVGVEGVLLNIADAFDLVALAASDFGGFMAEILGRAGDFANVTAGNLAGLGTAAGPGGRAALGAVGLGQLATNRNEEIFGGIGDFFGGLSAGFGPRPQLAGGASTTTVNQDGTTINVAAIQSPDEIADILYRRTAADRKRAMDATRGGDR